MHTTSNARVLGYFLLASISFWFAACTAAFGPGYTIERQEIRVHFFPSPQPRIVIEADYALRNTGNQPLSELEVRLPGRRRFHFSNPQVGWDGAPLQRLTSPANQRNELLVLPEPWMISSAHTLHLSIEFQGDISASSTLGFANDAFFLPAQGWSPELLPSRGALATGGVPPKKWNLVVTVPTNFQVHLSGKSFKKSRNGNEATLRAEQTPSDYYPFVIAGNYQTTELGDKKQKVYLWTRSKQAAGSLHQASESLLLTTRTYDQVFGARIKPEESLWIVECPVSTGCFTEPVQSVGESSAVAESSAQGAEMATSDTLMVDVASGTEQLAASAGPQLAASWLGYGKNPGFFEQDFPLSALPTFAAAVGRDASSGPEARGRTIRTALRSVPQSTDKNTKDDRNTLRTKSFLFFYALQDRYGAEVFRKAMSHVFYSRQGRGFNLNDLIAAFDEETQQNMAEFVRRWMKHPGVPEEFRARYERDTAAAEFSKEATP